MMKIKVVVPVATDLWNGPAKRLMEPYKDRDTQIDVVNVDKGPESLECSYDEAHVELLTVKMAERAEEEGCDGVIIYCFSDPGLRAARESLSIPVTGIGESSMHIASLLGRRFTIISAGPPTHLPNQIRRLYDKLRMYELDHKCASVRSVKIAVLSLENEKKAQQERLVEEARIAVEEDGADSIILGCGGMLGVEKVIMGELHVPVIIPGLAALMICESLIRMGLAQSKRCFALPPIKKRNF